MTSSSREGSRRLPKPGGTSAGLACENAEACPVESGCIGGRYMPCIDVMRAHEQKMNLCDALEAIADDLPFRVDRLQCLVVASYLVPLLRECHRFEEETIFPAYARARGTDAVLERLRSEHLVDEGAADELTDVLLQTGHGRPIENPEALGYMLRAFFESTRRHVAFERDHILPAITATPQGGAANA